MTDQSDNVPLLPKQDGIAVPDNYKTITIPIGQVVVGGERRMMKRAKVAELMESIRSVGMLNPIVVVRKGEDGKKFELVAGLHRREAIKQLGIATIQCTVLEHYDVLRIELAKIDENFIRCDPTPAQHALLTGRRREVIRALAAQEGTLSQVETASRQAKRRDGQRTGPDAASVRDQANKTGEGKDKVHRSTKRFDILGPEILQNLEGTSLDKGAQLDALTKLSEEVRDELTDRALAGAAVSATQALREAKREAKEEEQQHQSPLSDLRLAYDEFCEWIEKYTDVLEAEGLMEQSVAFANAFYGVAFASEDADAPDRTSEPAKKGKWFNWRKDRKGD